MSTEPKQSGGITRGDANILKTVMVVLLFVVFLGTVPSGGIGGFLVFAVFLLIGFAGFRWLAGIVQNDPSASEATKSISATGTAGVVPPKWTASMPLPTEGVSCAGAFRIITLREHDIRIEPRRDGAWRSVMSAVTEPSESVVPYSQVQAVIFLRPQPQSGARTAAGYATILAGGGFMNATRMFDDWTGVLQIRLAGVPQPMASLANWNTLESRDPFLVSFDKEQLAQMEEVVTYIRHRTERNGQAVAVAPVAGGNLGGNLAQELRELHQLQVEGIITAEEFAAKKTQLLKL